MEVTNFEMLVMESRSFLRANFEKYLDTELGDFRNGILDRLQSCCSAFEETTLVENLKEEFQDCLKRLAAE